MNSTPADYPVFCSSIAVKDAAAAIAFYTGVFGAVETLKLFDASTGMIGHAEMKIGDGLLMLGEECPGYSRSPATLGGTTVKFSLMVDDVDAAFDAAVAAGATALMQPSDQFYGFRSGTIRDPFGHEWILQREIEKVSPEEMQRRWDEMVDGCKSDDPAGR